MIETIPIATCGIGSNFFLGKITMPACLEWAEERIEECNNWRDDGENQCDGWGPFGFLCVAFVWVASWVCIGWTVVTTSFCVVWDVATSILNLVLVTVESTVGWLFNAAAILIELIEAIPVLGAMVRWLRGIATHIVQSVLSLVDAGAGLIGIRPEKRLRVCTIILRDENGDTVASREFARAHLQLAVDTYKRDANVRIIPSRPYKYYNAFYESETVDDSWVIVDKESSDVDLLDPPCYFDGVLADWWFGGSKFQLKVTTNCAFGAWRRVFGYGGPVTVFMVRSIPEAEGCNLWITDYATVRGENIDLPAIPSSTRTTGHEIGHACNLWHVCVDDDNRNLMAVKKACDPDSETEQDRQRPRMNEMQVLLVRASKHVTYF